MPHSVSPEAMEEDDVNLPDASQELGEDGMDTSNGDTVASSKGPDIRLEELFQTDDEEDEFTSSPPIQSGAAAVENSSPPLVPM